MRLMTSTRALAAVAAMALAIGLVGCGGGGGGGTAATTVSLGGTAAAGIFKNADVKVYDAAAGETGTPLATGTTGDNGQYGPFNLPANFSKPLLIRVSAKADGTSTTDDEVFGPGIPMPSDFKMYSVVPAGSGAAVTGYATPFTNLMYNIVKNKIGKNDVSDLNGAINQARSLVMQMLGNVDPLTANPVTDPGMVVWLGATSNLARGEHACNTGDAAAKITCTVNTVSGAITSMAEGYDVNTPVPLGVDQGIINDLAAAAENLDLATVEGNTGISEANMSGPRNQAFQLMNQFALNSDVTPPSSAIASGITQAKYFFASLRTGILPYANSAGTGFLDTQGGKLSDELKALNDITLDGVNAVASIANWAGFLMEGEQPGECDNHTFPATCTLDVALGSPVQMTLTRDGNTVNWSTGSSGLTGTLVFSNDNSRITMNGYVPGMSGGATKAKVGNPDSDSDAEPMVIALDDLAGDVLKVTLQGSIKDLECGATTCVPVMKLSFASGSYAKVHDPLNGTVDPSKMSADITGVFVTPNYRFTGKLAATNLQANGELLIGGTASFTGTINGVGLTGLDNDSANNFDMLVGKLEAQVNGKPKGSSWSYDSEQPESASNYQQTTMTFTGTTFRSASDPGLKLVFTMGWDWDVAGSQYRESLNVAYNDYNKGISLSGQTSRLESSKDPVSITLNDNNSISVIWTEGSSTVIRKDSLQLGTISGGRITYTDGTFESVL